MEIQTENDDDCDEGDCYGFQESIDRVMNLQKFNWKIKIIFRKIFEYNILKIVWNIESIHVWLFVDYLMIQQK